MLDSKKIKKFWDERSKYYQEMPLESIANLEQDPINLEIKIREEMQKVFSWLPDVSDKMVLDLGAGIGQWAFRLQEHGARHITAIEFSESMVENGRKEARNRAVENIEFVLSRAEDYISDNNFDVVLIFGLMIYLNDDQVRKLLQHMVAYTTPESFILLRDGTGVNERYEINNCFSEHLKTEYSATYRTADQYRDLFEQYGFELLKEDNMFPEGHTLNKYPETRLRLYQFRKQYD